LPMFIGKGFFIGATGVDTSRGERAARQADRA
jgi:hypothetical protein